MSSDESVEEDMRFAEKCYRDYVESIGNYETLVVSNECLSGLFPRLLKEEVAPEYPVVSARSAILESLSSVIIEKAHGGEIEDPSVAIDCLYWLGKASNSLWTFLKFS